jgi:hypothetical protein
MRPDQLQRIADLSEKLAEVVLEEADPDTWPGAGVPLAEMSNDQRGNRYWAKKNAAATFALLERTASLLADVKTVGNDRHKDDDELDAQIRSKEKEAAKMLERVMKGAKAASRGKA